MIQESYVNLFLLAQFGQLSDIWPKDFKFLKTFNSEFSYTEVWFTDHNYKLLGMEGKIGITLLIS